MPDGSEAAERALERALLGQEARLTAAEVASQAGVPLDKARRLWRSLGFPTHGEEAAYTDADVEALRILSRVMGDGVVDLDLALNVARGLGLSMARLADWEVGATAQPASSFYEASGRGADRLSAITWLLDEYGERFDQLVLYAWRRHLAAAVVRMEAARAFDDDPQTTSLTVGFADIVGFTALSNDLSSDRIGDLVELFEARCSDVIANNSGRLIKSMGDAVLFVNDDAMAAFTTAEGIINVVGRDKRMPDVRLGLASGPVVMRLGDVYGPAVNLASRLTQVARRNRIIIDNGTADLLPPDRVETRPLPARPLRGFGVLEPLAARRV